MRQRSQKGKSIHFLQNRESGLPFPPQRDAQNPFQHFVLSSLMSSLYFSFASTFFFFNPSPVPLSFSRWTLCPSSQHLRKIRTWERLKAPHACEVQKTKHLLRFFPTRSRASLGKGFGYVGSRCTNLLYAVVISPSKKQINIKVSKDLQTKERFPAVKSNPAAKKLTVSTDTIRVTGTLSRAENLPKSCSSHLIYPVTLLSHTPAKWSKNTDLGNTFLSNSCEKKKKKKLQRRKMRVFHSPGTFICKTNKQSDKKNKNLTFGFNLKTEHWTKWTIT